MAYRAIYQINTLLDKSEIFRLENTDLTEDDKTLLTRYENEARWLRGVWYFNLAYLWGDVPLFLHAEQPADIYKPRTPVAQIWEQVIADFTAATAATATLLAIIGCTIVDKHQLQAHIVPTILHIEIAGRQCLIDLFEIIVKFRVFSTSVHSRIQILICT